MTAFRTARFENIKTLNAERVFWIVKGVPKAEADPSGAIRKRDQIPGSCCGGGGCEDCCYSWFCSCCTQAQIMRHVGMKADNYNLCAPGGMV